MRVALTMIVRDEERHLGDALLSARDLVDEMVVVDTGSTDATQAIARRLGARVLEDRWRGDFAGPRNKALAATKADWALVMDADERFDGHPSEVRKVLRRKGVVALDVPIVSHLVGSEHLHSATRLFRLAPGVRFERRLHEQVLPSVARAFPAGRVVRAPFRLIHLGYREDEIRRKDKHRRNLKLAEAEVKAHPEDAFARMNAAVEYLASGDAVRAVQAFDWSRRLVTTTEHWQSRLYKVEVQALLSLGRVEEARSLLEEGLGRFPAFTDLVFFKGLVFYEAGDRDEAARFFARCLRMGPAPTPPYDGVDPHLGAASPLFMLGRIALDEGRPAKALALLTRSVATRPDGVQAVEALVKAAMALGRDPGGIVAASPPPEPLALGVVLFRLGDSLDALAAFERAEALHPSLPREHHLTVAACLLALERVDEARLRLARAGDPSDFPARTFIADALRLREGRLTREAAHAMYPSSHFFWRLAGGGPEEP